MFSQAHRSVQQLCKSGSCPTFGCSEEMVQLTVKREMLSLSGEHSLKDNAVPGQDQEVYSKGNALFIFYLFFSPH